MLDIEVAAHFARSMNSIRASEGQSNYSDAEITACWVTMHEEEREEWRALAREARADWITGAELDQLLDDVLGPA